MAGRFRLSAQTNCTRLIRAYEHIV